MPKAYNSKDEAPTYKHSQWYTWISD